MSVLIPDQKIYGAIATKMFYATSHNVCDINYFHSCFSFTNPLTDEKIREIVSTWCDLNEITYVSRYGANHPEEKYEAIYKDLDLHFYFDAPSTYQFLKWLRCIHYNIERETIEELRPLTEHEEYCLKFLEQLIEEAAGAIISALPEYDKASWSDFVESE